MTWFANLARWFRGPSNTSDEPCTDGRLRSLRRDLESEQRGLAADLERLFVAYDEQMGSLAARLSRMDDATLEREWEAVKRQQTDIRRLLQRFETSVRSRQDLERELAAWEARTDGDERAEIIRSELAVRGVRRDLRPVLAAPEPMEASEIDDAPEDADNPIARIPPLDPESLPEVSTEHLLAAIRDAVREADRWHAVPKDAMGEDALVQLHHVRDLHAMLRRLDRRKGIRRDRLELAVSPQALHVLVEE